MKTSLAFKKHKSTAHGILHLLNNIGSTLKNGNFCCTLFLDLTKAFDSVDHHTLLGKLEKIGIRGPVLKWFGSYLHNRLQCVKCNDTLSNPILMKYGVPQGSVLGPLLFLVYINDMPSASDKFSFTLFADDTCITATHKDIAQLEILVNTELVKIEQWLVNKKLSLNIAKSCYLIFSGEKNVNLNTKVFLAGKEISRKTLVKYLGVIINDKLSWNEHIASVLRKIRQGSGIMKRLSYLVPNSVNCSLYYSFIQSHTYNIV